MRRALCATASCSADSESVPVFCWPGEDAERLWRLVQQWRLEAQYFLHKECCGAVDMHQHPFEFGQVEPAQTVTQHIIAQRPRGTDPVLEGGL